VVGRLIYPIDTNVWLELLLGQDRAGEVRQFLQRVEPHRLAITEFSLYSIGVILTRLGKDDAFADFLSDTIEDSGVIRVRLDTVDLKRVLTMRQQFRLDFDDGCQYVAAEKHGYVLISLDSDFDHTDRGRKTPVEALAQ